MPRKCTECIFYSRTRRRCLKLGVPVTDPSNPPCLKGKKTIIVKRIKEEEKETREEKIEIPEKVRVPKEAPPQLSTKPVTPTIEVTKIDELRIIVDNLIKIRNELEDFLIKYVQLKSMINDKSALKELEEKKSFLERRFLELEKKALQLGAIRCPVCNAPMSPNDKKCPFCGHIIS